MSAHLEFADSYQASRGTQAHRVRNAVWRGTMRARPGGMPGAAAGDSPEHHDSESESESLDSKLSLYYY